MEINQIRYAYFVSKYHSFSKAADRLFVTQPTLSQQIRKLEDEIGFKIFSRSTRSVVLTREGEIFVESAKKILEDYETFEKNIYAIRGLKKKLLTVGALTTFFDFSFADNVIKFEEDLTDIDFSLNIASSETLMNGLFAHKYNAVIAFVTDDQRKTMSKNIETKLLKTNSIDVILNKDDPLTRNDQIHIEELNDTVIYMQEKRSPIDKYAESLIKEYGVVPRQIKTCSSIDIILGNVGLGHGVCFHSSAAIPEKYKGKLINRPLIPARGISIYLMYMKDSPDIELLERFNEYLHLPVKE